MLRGLSSNFSYTRNEVRVYANAIAGAGSTLTNSSQLAVNGFLNKLQADGILAKTKECCLFLGFTVNGALVKLIGAGAITNNGLTLSYSEATGIQGDSAIAGSLDTGFIPASNGLPATDVCLAAYTMNSTWTNMLIGSGSAPTNGVFYVGFNASGGFSFLAGAAPTHPAGNGINLAAANPGSVRSYTRYFQRNSVVPGSFSGSVVVPDQQVKLFNYYQGAYFPSDVLLGGYWIGNDLSQIEVGKLSSAFDQLSFSVGRKAALSAVFFGDSITFGVGASIQANRWTSVLCSRLGITENNKGISGTVLQNTSPTQANNGRDRYPTDVYSQRPWRIFILYGINDIRYNSVDWTPASFQGDLQEVVSTLMAGGVHPDDIVLGTPPFVVGYVPTPPYDGGSTDRHLAHNEAVANVARTSGTRFVNVYQWMASNGGAALVSEDTVHPNDAGHKAIADAFLSAL